MSGSMTQTEPKPAYVVWDLATGAGATIRDERFMQFTERHHYRPQQTLQLQPGGTFDEEVRKTTPEGIVLVVHTGVPGNVLIDAGKRALARGLKAYYFWPHEEAVEVIDYERLRSFRKLWLSQKLYARMRKMKDKRVPAKPADPVAAAEVARRHVTAEEITAQAGQMSSETKSAQAHLASGIEWISSTGMGLVQQGRAHLGAVAGAGDATGITATIGQIEEHLRGVAGHFSGLAPVLSRIEGQAEAMEALARGLEYSPKLTQDEAVAECRTLRKSSKSHRIAFGSDPAAKLKNGAYVRLDFWAPLVTGGSYGHTVYQCRALAKSCENFVAIVANRFPTLDTLGVRQEIIRAPRAEGNEENLIDANRFYYDMLRLALGAMRPDFVFERLVPASYVCAKVCQELGIPYIAEYNGSELSMMKSFQGKTSPLEALYIEAEMLAFEQASVISVVSENVAADLTARGIPRSKILVNPNAVDLDAYKPGTESEITEMRGELGLLPSDRVIGFIGTFGGWHGLDVLAQALPQICSNNPAAKFLLIGDGTHKHLVKDAIDSNNLASRIIDKGRVPQREGARLLKVCDILVSPHSTHMVDAKFFGSPTKLFEYMAVGAGIVASDLEQIGAVLRPAIPGNHDPKAPVNDARAVLCKPGDVASFAEGVSLLVRNPQLSKQLGTNAREAARKYYTWDQHVTDLWAFAAGRPLGGMAADMQAKS